MSKVDWWMGLPRNWFAGLLNGNPLHGDGQGSCLQIVMAGQAVNQLMFGSRGRDGTSLAFLAKVLQGQGQVGGLVGGVGGQARGGVGAGEVKAAFDRSRAVDFLEVA